MDTLDTGERTTDQISPMTEALGNATKKKKPMPHKQRLAMLVVGDIIVFLLFSFIGRRSHNEAAGFDAFLQIVETAAPFALAWFLVSPFVGAFRRGVEMQPRTMLWRTGLGWLGAWPLSMLFRGIIERGVPPLTFALITLVTNMILLLLWRWPFALINKMRGR